MKEEKTYVIEVDEQDINALQAIAFEIESKKQMLAFLMSTSFEFKIDEEKVNAFEKGYSMLYAEQQVLIDRLVKKYKPIDLKDKPFTYNFDYQVGKAYYNESK